MPITVDQRLQLLNAGYTKQEIEEMLSPAAGDPPVPAPDPAPVDDPAPADPQPAPAGDPVIEEMSRRFEEELAKLRSEMQKQNISNVSNNIPKPPTAEEALGSLVAEPAKR